MIRTESFRRNLFAKVHNDVGDARFAGVEAILGFASDRDED